MNQSSQLAHFYNYLTGDPCNYIWYVLNIKFFQKREKANTEKLYIFDVKPTQMQIDEKKATNLVLLIPNPQVVQDLS